jgi:hypothetical protein
MVKKFVSWDEHNLFRQPRSHRALHRQFSKAATGYPRSDAALQARHFVVPGHFSCIANPVRGHQGWSNDPDTTARYALAVTFEIVGHEISFFDPMRTAVLELQTQIGLNLASCAVLDGLEHDLLFASKQRELAVPDSQGIADQVVAVSWRLRHIDILLVGLSHHFLVFFSCNQATNRLIIVKDTRESVGDRARQ